MKKLLVGMLALLLLLCSLASCAKKLSGSYGAMGITLTFDGTSFSAEKGESRGKGTYEIKEDENGARIYFTFAEGSGAYLATFTGILIGEDGVSFEEHEGFIRLAGIPFSEKK